MTQITQIQNSVDFSQEMVCWNPVIQPKFVEQLLLQPSALPHHPPVPPTDSMAIAEYQVTLGYYISISLQIRGLVQLDLGRL